MLEIHTAARADALLSALAERLSASVRDPFVPELIAVPTRGIERWIAQRLADVLGARDGHRDGVCANILFPFPGRLLGDALARACDLDPEQDPWHGDRLVWALLEALDGVRNEAWIEPLERHFAAEGDRRFSRARALGALFERYASARPDLIVRWANHQGQVENEDPRERWQARLWWHLRLTIGEPSPAERLEQACERLSAEPDLLELPDRLTLFGLTRLDEMPLRVMRAIAVRRDVHLMLVRACAPDVSTVANPLLLSWGREQQGFWRRLATIAVPPGPDDPNKASTRAQRLQPPSVVVNHHSDPAASASPPTLLGTLQRDIRENRRPPGVPLAHAEDRRLRLDRCDRSISVHSCHGRARQVQVLREAILHRLAADPTLEPRDVIIMCPEIETFAPLGNAPLGARGEAAGRVAAARGSDALADAGALGVRIADRSVRQTNPLLGAIARLLQLSVGRLRASEVLDLADSEPVRRRFQFDDDELAQIREWVAKAGIHWGLDAAGRAPYALASVDAGTWAAGMRRLALGVAIDAGGELPFAGVLPATQLSSEAISLLGRFMELIDRLDRSVRALSVTQTVSAWVAALGATADRLLSVSDEQAWQRDELDALLRECRQQASTARADIRLAPADMHALLSEALEGRPTRANFRTGELTLCRLAPMRSIPHRVICLLGLDDGAFPRHAPHDGDDLLLDDPQPSDRDPRAEDRQLLLDALLAAQDAVIITYSGHDERTNVKLPPAVPLGELLDVIDASAQIDAADGERAREAVVFNHPLQPFDPRNFTPAGQGPSPAGEGPWSFGTSALEGALALSTPRRRPAPLLDGPLPAYDDRGVVELDDLVRFLEHPARAFLRQRLGITSGAQDDELDDALPIELDGLARWGVGQRLLSALLRGVDARTAALAEIARGTLPPGALGEPVVRSIMPVAELLAQAARSHAPAAEPRSLETSVSFEDGTRLIGTVPGVRGDVILTISYSCLSPRQRLAAWVRLLALSAGHPGLPLEAVTIGRAPLGSDTDQQPAVAVARLPQLAPEAATREALARNELSKLIALRAEGLCEPLQLPSLTAAAFAGAALGSGGDPLTAATQAWRSRYGFEGEDADAAHRLLFPGGLDWDTLGARALALWRPLFAREHVERG